LSHGLQFGATYTRSTNISDSEEVLADSTAIDGGIQPAGATELSGPKLRGDFLNLFNHDNFRNSVVNMSSPNFGKNTFVPLTDASQVLLGSKFRF
jgi:hypothetical protein